MPSTYYVAWWNLDKPVRRGELAASHREGGPVTADGIAGWTPALRDRKVAQLASVIAQMNGGGGPGLLGVCEVEDRFVLDLLAGALAGQPLGRQYGIVHADTGDARGIDVAFLHDPGLLEAPADEVFFHVVMRRNATREIVRVNFGTHRGRAWAVFGNHWPSRSGGAFESSGFRHIAGETLSYFHQRALEVHGEGTPALAMGDFNDEPFDASLVLHALSTRQQRRVVEADTPRFWNLMWPPAGIPGRHVLFQQRAEPARPVPRQREHGTPGQPPSARRRAAWRSSASPEPSTRARTPNRGHSEAWGKPVDQNGFSDHFPIGMRVTEAD